MPYVPGPLELDGLRRKYIEIRRLRRAAEGDPTRDPRREMATLAAEFPGALREADELPMEEIERRLAALGAVRSPGEAVPLWMTVMVRFHALTRGALCAKRWLGTRRVFDDATARAFGVEAGSLCYAADALEWQHELSRVANPPRGRVTDLVFERLTTELGVPELQIRAHLFVDRGRWRGAPRARTNERVD